jgi:O-antigen/teichoic acid export membrane protein
MPYECKTSITKIKSGDKMQDKKPPVTNRFIGQGILLFFDQILVSITNWLYWLVISRFTVTSEIGQATTVYSLVLLLTTLCQIGLEYPLLRKSSLHRSQILGTALTIELILIPGMMATLMLLAYTNVYHASLSELLWVAVLLLVLSPISFIARFALLGISNARTVLVFDVLATGAKFLVAYILLSMGLGAFGILFSFMMASLVAAVGMLSIVRRRLPLTLIRDRGYIIKVIKEGLSNAPSKLSRTMIITLSVILLASFGISDSDVGIFYIAMMLSVVGASLATSISFTVIPASTESNIDLSSGSLRLGLTFSAPVVAALFVAPKDILSIIGPQYASADTILLVLSMGILPTAVAMNAISKFNNLGHGKRIITIGVIQTVGFLTSFLVLVPYYGTLGCAYSILIAYTASALYAISLFERAERRYVANSAVAVILGCVSGYAISFILDYSLLTIVSSVVATSAVLLAMRNTSVSELRQVIKSIQKPNPASYGKKS